MIRAASLVLLLCTLAPLAAQGFSDDELNELFARWQVEENRTLEGWRVLDEVGLYAKLAPLVGEETPEKATLLLGVAMTHGVGGAPRDPAAARELLLAARDHNRYGRVLVDWRFEVTPGADLKVHARLWGGSEPRTPSAGSAAGHALSAMAFLDAGPTHLSDAIESLKLASNWGCLPAQVVLATNLYRGSLLPRDVGRAQELLEAAANVDYLPALMELARFHHYRNGTRPDLELCRDYLDRAARAGCMGAGDLLRALPSRELAAHDLESLFEEYRDSWGAPLKVQSDRATPRLGFEPNPVLAAYPDVARWLRPHADPIEGEPNHLARCMLGECLLRGIGGVEADPAEGVSLLRAAWKEGEVAAAALLCGLYLAYNGDLGSSEEAAEMVLASVKARFQPALRFQAFASYDWIGFRLDQQMNELRLQDSSRAMRILAEVGDVYAIEHMARGANLKWLKLAAEAGMPEGMIGYADAITRGEVEDATPEQAEALYRHCLGFSATHVRARAYFDRKAAAPYAARAREYTRALEDSLELTGDYTQFLKDHPYALGPAQRAYENGQGAGELYGLCLYEGHGIDARRRHALGILLECESALGVYLSGRGHEDRADGRSAVWCYEAAAAVGAGYAAYRAGVLYRDGELRDKNLKTAADWFLKGAEAGCVPAMVELAKAYHNGTGVDKDAARAKEWAKRAADKGNETATELLDKWK